MEIRARPRRLRVSVVRCLAVIAVVSVMAAASLTTGTLAGRAVAGGGHSSPGQQPATRVADLVLRGGHVITVDAQERIAAAVAVAGNRIVAVGSDADMAQWIGPSTQVIDLRGRTLLPGFIDSHSHIEGLATSEHFLVPIQAPPLRDANEIIAKLKARAAQVPPGTWIVGQGTYNQVMPTREQLDRELPHHPVVLRWSAHDLLLNHMADEIAGLGRGTPDPKGMGRIERAVNGEPAVGSTLPIFLPKTKR